MNPKRAAIGAAIGVACLAGAYAAGRFSAPTRTVTVDHTAELQKAQEQIHALTAQLETVKRESERTTVVTFSPKTGKPLKSVTHAKTDSVRTSDTRSDTQQARAVETVRVETKTVTVEHATPKWFVGPLFVVVPGTVPQMSAGVIVGHTLFGPFALGVSATVPLSKPASVPAFGFSLTAAF